MEYLGMNRYIKMIAAIVIDFLAISAVFWSLHFILYYPWILIGIAMILSVGVRYEDFTRDR